MNEIYSSEMEYKPKVHYLGMAAVHVIFQPSDRLESSLNEFVKVEERYKYSALLKSNEVKTLRYTGGDANGLHYLDYDNSLDDVSDRNWIYQYKRSIDQIKSQSIPVAAYRPRLERTHTGALMVELALLPNNAVKRNIGNIALRTLYVNPSDHIPDEVVYARTLIPRSLLVDDEAIQGAQQRLIEHLGVIENISDNDGRTVTSHVSPKLERMFVKPAYVSDRPISHLQ